MRVWNTQCPYGQTALCLHGRVRTPSTPPRQVCVEQGPRLPPPGEVAIKKPHSGLWCGVQVAGSSQSAVLAVGAASRRKAGARARLSNVAMDGVLPRARHHMVVVLRAQG